MELISRVLEVRLVKNMTKNGKIPRFSVLVATGNGEGGVGLASASHVQAVDAISKASKIAAKNMMFFPLYQRRTLFHDDSLKFKATSISARPAPQDHGRRCHPAISEICRCVGIKDISAKIIGSTNPLNVSRAFIEILQRQKSPLQISREFGVKIVDVNQVFK